MSRILRQLRARSNAFSVATRVNTTSSPQPQIVRFQRVNIRRKWFKPVNFIIAAGVYFACYQIYTRSVFGILGEWLDEEEEHMSEKEKKEIDDMEPLFIPLPFTTRTVEPKPYRGSDAEWQTFIKVNNDRKRVKSIRQNLAEMAKKTVESHPGLVHRYGKDMKLSKYWLNIQYPYKPPPTFVRQGVSFDDDGLAIKERPIDSTTVFRLRKILYPSTLAGSLWSFTGALAKQDALILAKYIGYEPRESQTARIQSTIERVQEQLDKLPSKKVSQEPPSGLPSSKPHTSGASTADPLSTVDRPSRGPTEAPGPVGSNERVGTPIPTIPNAEPSKPKSVKDIYIIKTTQEHTSGPWHEFKKRFSQTWQPLRSYPPRGSFFVGGLIEINAPRAIIIVDALGWYDPKTEAFDTSTMSIRLRSINMKTQAPIR